MFIYSILIDCINGILQESYEIVFPIAVVYRGLIILLTVPFVFKNLVFWGNKLILLILIIYGFALFLWKINYNVPFIFEINNFIRVFYFYCILSYFIYYKNEFDKKRLMKLVFRYGFYISVVVIFGFFTGLGYRSYGEEFGFGTKGFFVAGNDLGLTVLFTLGFGLILFFTDRNWTSFSKLLVITLACFLIGSRTGWFGCFLLWFLSILYIIFKKDPTLGFDLKKRFLFFFGVLSVFGYAIIQFVSFITSLDAYVLERLSVEGIMSSRTVLIESAKTVIANFDTLSSLIGRGTYHLFRFSAESLGTRGDFRMVEADFYEYIGSYGYLFGGLILLLYILFFFRSIISLRKKTDFSGYVFSILLLLFLGVGYSAGHAISNTMVAPAYAVVVLLIYKAK